jgi:hypothetical protein
VFKTIKGIESLKYNKIEIITDKIWRSIRRWYYYNLKPNYIKQSLKNRKGKCEYWKCGGCCDDLIFNRKSCEYFNKKTGECKAWNTKQFPCSQKLKEYPFDEKDKSLRTKQKCTYYWEKRT